MTDPKAPETPETVPENADTLVAGQRAFGTLTPQELVRRRRRALALAFVLLFFVILVFVTSIVQFSNFTKAGGH